MDAFKVIAFTHKTLPIELIGKLHLDQEEQTNVLGALKINFNFEELLFLSTCNRIELLIKSSEEVTCLLVKEIALFLNSRLNNSETTLLSNAAELYLGASGVEHVLKVASSLDSMIVGEREIITQVRKAYDFCNLLGLTGDFIRLLIKQTIETAKDIYTNTDIARNPVSVASLAYRQLRQLGIKNDARILFVGSGETNTTLASYFQKHKFANFTVFNRTLENGKKLAKSLNGKAYELAVLADFKEGFDVLVVCTSSSEIIITEEIFESLKGRDNSKKVIIDLGLPSNVAKSVSENSQLSYIDINSLKAQADANLQLRKNEIVKCEEMINVRTQQFHALYAERRIELAFGEVPKQVRAIKDLALNEVFAKEINSLDIQSKEVLEKVLSYMEKKYNAVAIKTAKEVFLAPKN
ncbi:glutamyl-tRNA reductase [Aurantibacillus circumpalustris]|uniref:glutamyl-tRNA reductase n=1 Tax=Aurantibacillus circumpalustris TaxID=3036359 RepID=UPI00295A8333|nr:glutamyl-tRNA reductase [Aurantibacillus circumpalustris]